MSMDCTDPDGDDQNQNQGETKSLSQQLSNWAANDTFSQFGQGATKNLYLNSPNSYRDSRIEVRGSLIAGESPSISSVGLQTQILGGQPTSTQILSRKLDQMKKGNDYITSRHPPSMHQDKMMPFKPMVGDVPAAIPRRLTTMPDYIPTD